MNSDRSPVQQFLSGWMGFWYSPASLGQLAILRIGVGLILLFILFVGSFDIQAHYSLNGWGDLLTLRDLDPVAWPFSVFDWFANDFWLWAVQVLALLAALAFVLGVIPSWTGALSIVFLLSYLHRNPTVALGLDGILLMGIFYLALTPSGRVFSVLDGMGPVLRHATPMGLPADAGPSWAGFPIRMLQIHLSFLYFFSGIAKLSPDWLAGVAFWHPRVAETGLPLGFEWIQAYPQYSSFVIYGALLFQIFFAVFVWMPKFRYWALGTAVFVHLTVGVLWGKLPFNLLILVLDFAFVPAQHVDALLERLIPMLERRRSPIGRGQ